MTSKRALIEQQNSYFGNFSRIVATLIICLNAQPVFTLENGLARTPPMGWSTYLVYGCKACDNLLTDDTCMSENTIRDVADQLLIQGFANLGYQYIILDDCWQKRERDPDGWLDADPQRFPSTIPSLAKYIHDRNLKLGMFSDLGPYTGQLFPGSEGHYKQDSATFAQWQVDYVKMSGASANPNTMHWEYPDFGTYLASTGRAMLYATSWPIYQTSRSLKVDYNQVANYCNTWRFAGDAQPRWATILAIMDDYALKQTDIIDGVRPGSWADADLLVIGLEGVTEDQCKAQMAVWSIMPSSLIFSAKLRTLRPELKAILQNKDVIAINQDPLGKPGLRINHIGEILDIWRRPISPNNGNEYSYALAFVYRSESSFPIFYSVTLQELELNSPTGYYVTDLFQTGSYGTYNRKLMFPTSSLEMRINPQGVAFFKAELANVTPNTPPSSPLPAPTIGIIRYNQ